MNISLYAEELTRAVSPLIRVLSPDKRLAQVIEITESTSAEDMERNIRTVKEVARSLKSGASSKHSCLKDLLDALNCLHERFDIGSQELSMPQGVGFISPVLEKIILTAKEYINGTIAAMDAANEESKQRLREATDRFYELTVEMSQLRLKSWTAFRGLPAFPPDLAVDDGDDALRSVEGSPPLESTRVSSHHNASYEAMGDSLGRDFSRAKSFESSHGGEDSSGGKEGSQSS